MADLTQDPNWMQNLWRPMMGWMYMLICFTDMIVFPILWSLWQGLNHSPITQWDPLTLKGAGLFHIAMGAVLGIAAFGRTQEKLAGTAVNPTATSQTITNNNNITSNIPVGAGMGPMPANANFATQPPSGYGSPVPTYQPMAPQPPSDVGSPVPTYQPMARTANGKKIIPLGDDPIL